MRRAALPWGFALLACLTAAAGAAGPFDPFGLAGVDGRPGAQIPMSATFRDASGRPLSLAGAGAGRVLLLAPVQHHCPNICSATLTGLARSVAVSGVGARVSVVALGFDPRETPQDAAASAARLADLPRAAALVGSATQVGAVMHALSYRYAWDPRLAQYAHVAAVAVLTPDGRLSAWLYGVSPPPELLQAAVKVARGGGLSTVGERLLLLCYHYDPQAGAYDRPVMMALRVGGVATLLLLGGLVALAVRLGRRRRT